MKRQQLIQRQQGLSLLELVLAISISTIGIVLSIRQGIAEAEEVALEKAAKDIMLIGEAGEAYVTAQSGPTGSLTTMGADTVLVEISDLLAANSCGTKSCLAASLSDYAAPGSATANRYVMRVNRTGTAGNYTYSAAVYTIKPWTSGSGRRLDLAGAAVRKAGGNALLATTAGSMRIMGNTGVGAATISSTDFPELNAIGQLGYLATGGSANTNDSVYLRRDGLYPMTGALKMGNNSITGANDVNAATVATTGAVSAGSVATTGAVTANTVTASTNVQGQVIQASQEVRTVALNATGNITTDGQVIVGSSGDIIANNLSGANKSLTARLGQAAPMSSSSYILNGANPTATINKPACPTGSNPVLQLTNNSAAGGIYNARWGLQVQVTGAASSWGLSLLRATVPTATAPAPTDPDAIAGVAVTYCAF